MAISRRAALGGMAGGVAAAAVPLPALSTSRQGDLPNILWVVSEDNNPFIGAYGDRLAHTPNIDALARRGVLYRNVYSNAPVCAPSRFGILTGAYPETCAPGHHMRAVATLPPELRTYPEYLRAAGYYCTNNDKTDYNSDADPKRIWDDSSKTAHWRNRPTGKPFMAVFNYFTTHESQLFKQTPGRVTPDQVRIPAYLPDTPAIRSDYASYYNMIEKMDGQIGERLAELAADGLAEDTIVFYYSDNGGVLPRSKRYCYDEGLHNTKTVYVPPKWQHLCPVAPGSDVRTPVSFIDLAPTLLSLAGIRRPPQMQGAAFLGYHTAAPAKYVFGMRNRMDERYDFVRTVTDGRYRYIRNYMPHRIWGMHGDFEWQLKSYQSWDAERLAGRLTPVQDRFFQTKPFEEFYDLSADRDEIENLIDRPAHRARIAAFRSTLDAHLLEIRDNGFIPEGTPAEGYHQSRNDKIYPLRSIMTLAQAAARGDPRKIALLRNALSHTNYVVRYWAATGLLILKNRAAPAREELLKVATADPVDAVRVVAAEALCHIGLAPRGVEILGSLVDSSLPFPPRLQALNALASIGDDARPALPILRKVSDDKNEYIIRAARCLTAVLDGTYRPDMTFGRGAGG